MEITWYGHACFRLKDRNTTVVTDPYDKTLGLSLPRPKADIIYQPRLRTTQSYRLCEFKVVDGPGEYEIGGVFITGIHLTGPKKRTATTWLKNNIYVIYMEDTPSVTWET